MICCKDPDYVGVYINTLPNIFLASVFTFYTDEQWLLLDVFYYDT